SRITARRSNNGHATDEVSHERRQTIVLAVKPMVLYRDVLTLDVAGFVEAITECSGTARIRRPAIDEPDDRRLRLLCARRERPHRRAAEQRDELAPFHSITSSARASSVGGTSRPMALAVGKLMTNSNLVDCTTGRSAGLAPLRLRPV